ncbi:c-type cytochrome [Chitinophaga sp. NPDC101104]|uniref:c-type cytochrome n=1 Tax=Chitinophaga sp. NPDC101104 TaxID=3390561 RepID=UPI003CFC4894
MKNRYLLTAALLALLASCEGGVEPEENKGDITGIAASDTLIAEMVEAVPEVPETPEAKMARGKEIYAKTCQACHQENGAGIPNAFPPLAKSDYLNEDANRAIGIVLHGKTGEVTVNGTTYNSAMPAQTLSAKEVADVLTYVYGSWGNKAQDITLEMVTAAK